MSLNKTLLLGHYTIKYPPSLLTQLSLLSGGGWRGGGHCWPLSQSPMDEWTIKTPNPKCQLFFRIGLLTDFAALCITHFIDWRYIHSWLVFSTQLVNCCPPWTKELYLCTVVPLPSFWPHPPSPSQTKCTVIQTVCGCGRGVGGGGWVVL